MKRPKRTRPLTPGIEEYANNGFKFPMAEALKKHLSEISQEQFGAEWAEIERLQLEGPSFDEAHNIIDKYGVEKTREMFEEAKPKLNIIQILKEELERAFKHGQTNARMMEAGLERDEVNEYVNFRILALKDKI